MQVFHFVQSHQDLPMFCMGDMNEIMHPNEKHGPGTPHMCRINVFCDLVKRCGFLNLGYSGPAYTWTNKRFTSAPTFQRLDRCFANAEWCMIYPRTSVFHLPMLNSDHAPILTLLDSHKRSTTKPFRFENWWLLEDDYNSIAKNSWAKSANRPFHHKTRFLATDLKTWRRKKPRIDEQLNRIEDSILQAQSIHPSLQDYTLQDHLARQHQQLIEKDEHFHLQRAKKNWAQLGDRNTKYFHQAIIKRTRKNRITFLQNPDGTESVTHDQLAQTLSNYFYDIFAVQATTHHVHAEQAGRADSSNTRGPRADNLPHHSEGPDNADLNQDQMRYTDSIPTMQELHSIIKHMRSNASPGPDGLNAAFYKSAWPWIGQDVYQMVYDFYTQAFMILEINKTYLVLIPKKMQPTIPQDFRPISLCNVAYKLISKTLAERLKPHLPHNIDASQSAFVKDRHISTNIIITQEIIHSFSLRSWTDTAFLLKIDLAKAFDRLKWDFIVCALQRLHLSPTFINLVYQCISTASFSILLNLLEESDRDVPSPLPLCGCHQLTFYLSSKSTS
jgi:hypothetical protein